MLEELLKYLGMDPEKVKDAAAFQTEFVKGYYNKKHFEDQKSPAFRELFPVMIGKFAGANQVKIQKKLKEAGFDLTDDEMKEKGFEDVLDMAFDTVITGSKKKIEELTGDAGKNTDQKVKDWEEKYNKLESKFKDTEKLLGTTKETLKTKETEFTTKIKNFSLDSERGNLYKGVKWNDQVKSDSIKQSGFFTEFEKHHALDLDEKGKLYVTDKATGERIPSKSKNGEFVSPDEAIKNFGLQHKVWEENPHGGRQTEKRNFSTEKANLEKPKSGGIFEGRNTERKVSGSIKLDEE